MMRIGGRLRLSVISRWAQSSFWMPETTSNILYCTKNRGPDDPLLVHQNLSMLRMDHRGYFGYAGNTWPRNKLGAIRFSSAPKKEESEPSVSSGAGKLDAAMTKARMASPIIGLLAGLVGSVVGVGGGVLMVPLLAIFCSTIPQRTISGTTLAPVVSTGCAASLVYGTNGSVDFHSAALMSASALLAAPLGARMTMVLDNRNLKCVLGYFLVSAGALTSAQAISVTWFESSSGSYLTQLKQNEDVDAEDPTDKHPSSLFLVGSGLTAGYASGLLGIGGGTILTPLLTVATQMPQTLVLGTSLMATIAPSVVGLFQHQRLGNIDWVLGAGLAAGTLVGGFLGSNVALALPENALKGIFAITMFALGRLTLLKAKKQMP